MPDDIANLYRELPVSSDAVGQGDLVIFWESESNYLLGLILSDNVDGSSFFHVLSDTGNSRKLRWFPRDKIVCRSSRS